MTLTVTHAKNVAIADDPKAAAAGEVLPSDWNANHTVTGVALELAGGNLTFYVATTGSDSNNGTSALTPFRTISRAISVALSFDYQSLYSAIIQVADGNNYPENPIFNPLYNAASRAQIIGNTTTPTKVLINPSSGLQTIVTFQGGGQWSISGFGIVADPTISGLGNFGNMIFIDHTDVILTVLDFNYGSAGLGTYNAIIQATQYSKVGTGGVASWTIHGTGNSLFQGALFSSTRWSNLITAETITFSTAYNMGGIPVISASTNAHLIYNSTFVNPGNITGGAPIALTNESHMVVGSDPATITWPGGAFDPTQIDGSCNIDGNFYALQKSGLPANTDIYPGAWRFIKDTSGGGIYAVYNDAGTIKKVALT